ncbi:hypothetical protein [Rhizobium sp. Root1220]|uniref:hypothetical protein n=1 Tax=Rhizobium sp. Root1220 TaxID=1736432 RepID=UPI0006FFDD95|nr:hypothetical protein [Rhizobium sp. Root1220]KQV66136.1 hypothetical protein ASC90_13095 [Rhizobium sp. Root1220]
MTLILFIPAFLMTLVSAFADAPTPVKALDIAAVRTIVITGDASDVNISANAGEPYRAATNARRDGWFASWYSSWFFSSCRDRSRMRIDGTTLRVEVMRTPLLDLSDCTPEVSANALPGVAIRIDQQAVRAQLSGNFDSVGISGKAADVTLDGHASAVDILGAAVRVRLSYDQVKRDETVDIAAQSLDADLGFGNDVPVDYTVTAKASYVDSLAPSMPGAKPLVTIRGDYVRARIR